MTKLARFASGNGSNAENIVEYFKNHERIGVSLIVSNNHEAMVLDRAKRLDVPTYTFDKATFYESQDVLEELRAKNIDYIILAGFMWLIPDYLVKGYENRMLNIHPALLPKFGGKGMYGDRVHKAVKEAGENESGITIHLVNELYDDGAILFQARCKIETGDSVDAIADKVHRLEYQHYPVVIESTVLKSFKND